MKNIETILKEAGIEVTDERMVAVTKATNENYKAIADYEKQKEKVATLEKDLKETKDALDTFSGVDVEGYKKQIEDLKKDLEVREADLKDKDAKYAEQLAERDFNDLIEKAITAKDGKNAKAIKALLDMEALKGSKNQQADIEKALEDLAEAEDSAMLFGEPDPQHIGAGDLIGTVRKDGHAEDTTMSSALADYYGKK